MICNVKLLPKQESRSKGSKRAEVINASRGAKVKAANEQRAAREKK